MQLTRGWRELVLFWVGIAALGGVGAGILQMIGPPVPIDDLAQDERADVIFVEFAGMPTVAADAAQRRGGRNAERRGQDRQHHLRLKSRRSRR